MWGRPRRPGQLLVLGFAAGEIPTVKVNRLLPGNTAVVGVASWEFFDQQPGTVAEPWARLKVVLSRQVEAGQPAHTVLCPSHDHSNVPECR